jgi:putative solute:sodium symporter small subunit
MVLPIWLMCSMSMAGVVVPGKGWIFSWARMSAMKPTPRDDYWRRTRRLTAGLLLAWALAAFAPVYFARELSVEVFGWPLAFWWASQGALLAFCAIVVAYARRMRRLDGAAGVTPPETR